MTGPRKRFRHEVRPLIDCQGKRRKAAEVARSYRPADNLFTGCQSVGDKLGMLAKVWADSFEWRAEEADALRDFERRLTALEQRVAEMEAQHER